ncbi:MAG: hypothetical protein NVS2B9_09370 [Myxococcales bacterium]
MKMPSPRVSVFAILLVLVACRHGAARRWATEGAIVGEERLIDEITGRPVYLVADDAKVLLAPDGPPSVEDTSVSAKLVSPTAGMTKVINHGSLERTPAFEILRRGASYGDDFVERKPDAIWSNLTDEAKASRKDQASFERMVLEVRSALGEETRIRGEYVTSAKNGGVSYWRDAVYEKAPSGIVLELTFAPNSTRLLTNFALYRAETRPFRVKTLEPGDAPR